MVLSSVSDTGIGKRCSANLTKMAPNPCPGANSCGDFAGSANPGMVSFMQPIHLKNIRFLRSLCPIQISRPRQPYPRHWKLNQRIPSQPQTLGEQIKKYRLELHWLQTDVAAKIGISSTSVSNWERGVSSPSRRMTKRIAEFLSYMPPSLVAKYRVLNSTCQICGISKDSPENYLFELVCNSFNKNKM